MRRPGYAYLHCAQLLYSQVYDRSVVHNAIVRSVIMHKVIVHTARLRTALLYTMRLCTALLRTNTIVHNSANQFVPWTKTKQATFHHSCALQNNRLSE